MANFFKNMVKLTYNYFLAKLNFKLPAAAWRTEWNHFKISIISKFIFRYLFDAKWQNPFRSARIITSYLEGKNKPIYSPGVDCGDHVVVINSRNISLLGREWRYRVYMHHPGYFKVSILDFWCSQIIHLYLTKICFVIRVNISRNIPEEVPSGYLLGSYIQEIRH